MYLIFVNHALTAPASDKSYKSVSLFFCKKLFRFLRAFRVQNFLRVLASSRSKNNLKRMYMLYLIIFM